MFFLRTNVPPWGPSLELQQIDEALVLGGAHPIDLDWTAYRYEADGQHFQRTDATTFCLDLARLLRPMGGTWLVLSDSTLGWHEHIPATFASMLPKGSVVDAVNGSGFVAEARSGRNFRARLRRGYDHTLFIGGWNDEGRRGVTYAIHGTLAPTTRHLASPRS